MNLDFMITPLLIDKGMFSFAGPVTVLYVQEVVTILHTVCPRSSDPFYILCVQ